uniref:uncharacterized protein LOC120335287 n=1 Tax=Styela clava TaxID=7725 RepID=UPI00193AD6DF|nr:uncharacterized protein LOC120335287 [Styela clava]
MKSGNEIKDKTTSVKRFQYKSPKKKTSLPEQWSTEFARDQFQNNAPSNIGLDNAWSIRKNVSIETAKPNTDSYISHNSVYSRHKGFGATVPQGNATTMKSSTFTPDKYGYSSTKGEPSYSYVSKSMPQYSGSSQRIPESNFASQSSLQCRIKPCSEQNNDITRFKSDSGFDENNSDSAFDF